MRKAAASLLNLLYPKRAVCMGCGTMAGFERDWLCESCRRTLAKMRLGARTDDRLDGMAVAYGYKGPAGSMVRRLKFDGVTALAEPMADAMLIVYERIQPTGAEEVAAVPMHPIRLRRRGFNHSALLAEVIARRLNLPICDALVRTRNTVQQARLSGEERRRNLKDAFYAAPSVAGKRILLVDDVYTTGETARECASALRIAGARNVYFLAFAMGGE